MEWTEQTMLEVVAGMRCPCGHLPDEHEESDGVFEGEKFGPCRECECGGLIEFDYEDDDWDG